MKHFHESRSKLSERRRRWLYRNADKLDVPFSAPPLDPFMLLLRRVRL
jgi:hypothetical protein